MAPRAITVTEPLITTIFGNTALAVDLTFIFDDITCDFTFTSATPTATGFTFGGTGPTWTVTVTNVGTEIAECEDPPDTCQKIITINIRVREILSLTIPLVGTFVVRRSRVIRNDNFKYATECFAECCS